MPFNPEKHERVSLLVHVGGREELKMKARNAGERSVNAYANKMLFNGTLKKKKP